MSEKNKTLPLKPCPFCGGVATSQPWHGGGPRKTLVECANEDCDINPAITGTTKRTAAIKWNRRAKGKQ